jgi:protein-disulfide isomerase
MSDPSLEEINEPQKEAPPALTIVIQSWTTPIVGVVMLLLGGLAGFALRPSVLGESPAAVVQSSQPQTTAEVEQAAVPTISAADAEKIMSQVIPETRHFIGDESAPVTIIEFSDFL